MPANAPSRLRRAFKASSTSGAFWYSSRQMGVGPPTACAEFATTASRTLGSSRSMTSTFRASANIRNNVDFPTDLGPCNAMIGSSSVRASRMSRIRLAAMVLNCAAIGALYQTSHRRSQDTPSSIPKIRWVPFRKRALKSRKMLTVRLAKQQLAQRQGRFAGVRSSMRKRPRSPIG